MDLKNVIDTIDKYIYNVNGCSNNNSKAIIIDYGINQKELWDNFSKMMEIIDALEENDEVYIDITHSFRSIPLFMYIILEFIKTLKNKNINLKALYYGMFEANSDLGYTPIVDLNPILEMSDWIKATNSFIEFGNGYQIASLLKKRQAPEINRLADIIKNLSNHININYLSDLRHEIREIKKIYPNLKELEGALYYVLPNIKKFTKMFDNNIDDSEFQFILSKWCFENKRYSHGYICLVESLITKICEIYKKNPNHLREREVMKNVFYIKDGVKDEIIELGKLYEVANEFRKKAAYGSFIKIKKYNNYNNPINDNMNLLENIEKLLNTEYIQNLRKYISYKKIENYKN